MQRIFAIDSREENSILKAWWTGANKRLRDIFHDIRENDASTHWLIEDILQALRAYWDSPEYKMKQVKAQASRGSARGDPLHTGGSTTIEGKRLNGKYHPLHLFSYLTFVLHII